MGGVFRDTIFVDNGIQQLGTAFIYNETYDIDYNYELYIETGVPCFTYVMIMVEVSGVISNGRSGGIFEQGTSCVKQAWNFYTYSYDIGNINGIRGANSINMQQPYCYDGVRVMCAGAVFDKQYMGLVIDVYAVAGNGARYPVEIINSYLSPIT